MPDGQSSKSRPHSRRVHRRSHLSNVWNSRFPTTLDQGVPIKAASSDKKTIHTTSSRRHKRNEIASWMEIALNIAVINPQGADVWVGMWTLMLTRFENNNSTYTNALTNLSEKVLVFYRKALKELLKTLAEAVSEPWRERPEAIKKLVEHTKTVEREHFRRSSHPL